jgi:hypothetical protein
VGVRAFGKVPSGETYHVSDHRRAFVAHAQDVSALLRNKDVILAP